MAVIYSWGRNRASQCDQLTPLWSSQMVRFAGDKSFLPIGQGRSYGDCGLNDGNVVILSQNLRHLLDFDSERGIIEVESGTTIEDILKFAVPRGWFIPVTPGTKFVSVGGAIANDVHGKNHHSAGTFGDHVLEFELLRSSGERLICSRSQNREYFHATLGGLGLTGFILSAKIQLKAVSTPYMICENIAFDSIDEFLKVSRKYSSQYEYTVAWMDCASAGKMFGRGIFMCGEHADNSSLSLLGVPKFRSHALPVPFDAPKCLLNRPLISAFNKAYFYLKARKSGRFSSHYEPFFYPLDNALSWNKLYGKGGFFQFQAVVPHTSDAQPFKTVLDTVKQSGLASYLVVVKEFGEIMPQGVMSFSRKGITICLDFPNRGAPTIKLLKKLNDMVCQSGGALYPAKDATMSAENFRNSFHGIDQFSKLIDAKFSSSLWRRVSA